MPSAWVYPNILYSVDALMIIFGVSKAVYLLWNFIIVSLGTLPTRFLIDKIFPMWLNDRLPSQNSTACNFLRSDSRRAYRPDSNDKVNQK